MVILPRNSRSRVSHALQLLQFWVNIKVAVHCISIGCADEYTNFLSGTTWSYCHTVCNWNFFVCDNWGSDYGWHLSRLGPMFDECKRLCQSIKYGLVKRLTVGQVLEKAIVLQEVRLNDWLEGELIRLNHLRDQASEKGQKKQLRECVEKLELLKSPEERQRRLQAAPEVHVDPNCESDEDDGLINNKKRDDSVAPRYHEDSRNGWGPPYIQNGDFSTGIGIKNSGSDASVKPVNRVKSAGLFPSTGIISLEARQRLLLPTSAAINASETEMLWNYRDPNGKVQGPFCMIQLRKWSTTGYFPLDMRVWRVNDVEADSLLMTDLLNGKVKRVMPQHYSSTQSLHYLRKPGVYLTLHHSTTKVGCPVA